MSFVRQRIDISDKIPPRQAAHLFKMCSKCKQERPPEGGIQMSPTKWICAPCWTRRATNRKTI